MCQSPQAVCQAYPSPQQPTRLGLQEHAWPASRAARCCMATDFALQPDGPDQTLRTIPPPPTLFQEEKKPDLYSLVTFHTVPFACCTRPVAWPRSMVMTAAPPVVVTCRGAAVQ